jgi:Ser/Thr protein kinase RdoA (MazF antagonist)
MSEDKSSIISQNVPTIRPPTNQLMCKDLIKKLYNFDINQIKELNGYDDRNYYVMTCDSNEFILKITNSLESNICGLIGMTC